MKFSDLGDKGPEFKTQGVAEGGFKNKFAEFSGYGNYMRSRAPNVFKHFGLQVIDKEYSEDDDIQTYTVQGDKDSIDQARAHLERSEQFGGVIYKQGVTEEFVDEASLAQMRDYFAGKMSLTDEPAKSKPGELARMRDHFSKEKPMAKGGTTPNPITDKMPPDIVMILHAINKGTAITKAQFNRLHSYKMYGESVEDVAEASPRVDSLVTDALKIMQGAEVGDAVAALKTVLGNREYNSRRGHYNFYVKQIMDMSGQQGVAEGDLKEFAPDNSGGDGGEEDVLLKFARMWYNGDEATQQQVEKALARQGWEIGELESEEGGAFVVQSGDMNGDTYIGFAVNDLTEAGNAYAIGMSQAMKSTGDTPPLKKSTINKAHKIARAIEKDQ
jgi:hypothetical protein